MNTKSRMMLVAIACTVASCSGDEASNAVSVDAVENDAGCVDDAPVVDAAQACAEKDGVCP
jgi:hypothetical protein